MKTMLNKKGDFPSTIYIIISIFIVAILFLFFSHASDQFYDKFDQYFDNNAQFNNSEAHNAINKINVVEQSAWDYGFLAIFLGYVIALIFTAYIGRFNAGFYWIYAILTGLGLLLGVMFANFWKQLAVDPTLSGTVSRFPITDSILQNYPLVITIIIFLSLIFLFGKSQQGVGGFG